MATTVAQHSVATFTSPVNGTTPIDANTVRGNDNTTRAAYNDHDADPGIHVQSSSLASRPVAGTAGRKWITEDSGVYTLWFDDGTNWHPVSSENIALTVLAGENLVKGDVVKVTGWNNGQDLPEVVKTTSASDTAFAVITATVSSGSMGYATNTGIVQDVNTAAYSVGAILYANGSGGFTSTKPTSGNYQPVAYVMRSNTNNGVYYVEFSTPRIVERSDNTASTVVLRDASGNFSAGTVSVGALTSAGLVTFASLKGTGATTVTDILNDSTMATASATTLATSASIKTYVDNKVATVDTLAEVLANGNTTGANDIIVNSGQKIRTPAVAAQDGTSAISIANSTGALTLNTALADSNLATISTAGKVSNSATTATSANTASAIVARDGSGNFSAGTITATLNGAAPAGSLSGNTLASGVTASSLTSVGTLSSLLVSGNVGIGPQGTTGGARLTVSLAGSTDVAEFWSNQANTFIRFIDGNTTVKPRIGTASGNDLVFQTAPPAGTATTRVQIDANGNLAVDTNTLYVDAANNRVGVGTASPSDSVTISGGASGSYGLTINNAQVGGGTKAYLQYDATNGIALLAGVTANGLAFQTLTGGNVTTKATIDASGNLGLGVTPSAWSSSYTAMQIRSLSLFGSTSNSEASIGGNVFVNTSGQYAYRSSTLASVYQQVNGTHAWFTAPSGTAGNAITFTQAMTLDASGNLAIGTDTPGTALGRVFRINGASSGTNTGLIFSNALTDNGTAYSSNTQFVLGSLSAIPTVFVTNNTERARITSGGNLLVGTTTDNGRVTIENAGIVLYGRRTNAGGLAIFRNGDDAGYGFDFRSSGDTNVGSITWTASATTYATSSDRRLKTAIQPAGDSGPLIDAITIVQHDWKVGGHVPYGVIAQDLIHVAPEAVKAGDTGDEITTAWGVDYSKLVPMLIKEIQSLRSRVAALESN